VLEEIVGEITDEYDEEEVTHTRVNERTWIFEGRVALTDMYRILGIDGELFEQHKGDSGTIGGFILELTGRIPKKGEQVSLQNFTFAVEVSDNKRVRRVKVIMHDEAKP
jgi:putative hemolysin